MVITILEAQVAVEKAALLEAIYKQATEHLDAGILPTFLLRSAKEPMVWQSREALEAMRQSGETPRGVVMFQRVGAAPVCV
jgi:hypothetical protein